VSEKDETKAIIPQGEVEEVEINGIVYTYVNGFLISAMTIEQKKNLEKLIGDVK